MNECDLEAVPLFVAIRHIWLLGLDSRPMNECDLEAVPLFVAIRHIWLLGLDTGNGDDWGYGGLDTNYFDWGLTFLRDWEAEHLTGM
jgi:hypothetical protein